VRGAEGVEGPSSRAVDCRRASCRRARARSGTRRVGGCAAVAARPRVRRSRPPGSSSRPCVAPARAPRPGGTGTFDADRRVVRPRPACSHYRVQLRAGTFVPRRSCRGCWSHADRPTDHCPSRCRPDGHPRSRSAGLRAASVARPASNPPRLIT